MPHTKVDVLVRLREEASSKDASSLSHVELLIDARQLSAEKSMVRSSLGGFRKFLLRKFFCLLPGSSDLSQKFRGLHLRSFGQAQHLESMKFLLGLSWLVANMLLLREM